MSSVKKESEKATLSSMEVKGLEPGSMEERVQKLHNVYTKTIKPLEVLYKYDAFAPSWFEETVLNQKPLVTFFGPWSAGKTTFINHLLQHNYLKTGPQPTTDSFTIVMHGNNPTTIDGQVLANAKNLPFRGLDVFGEAFLRRFSGFQAPHPLLQRVTFVDTPGILESAQDIRKRGYDYAKVCRWFAEQSDLIFVIFDPTKLDAGAELRMLFTYALNGYESRVRLIMNKADSIEPQELMRVYGSLFWNFSNLIRTTEPPRVYLGSFWNKPYREAGFASLFNYEKSDLLWELMNSVPAQARDRKVAAVIKRAKSVLLHALIVGTVKSRLPKVFMVNKAKKKSIEQLDETYKSVAKENKINLSDFPPVSEEQKFLRENDVERFPLLEKSRKAIAAVRECIDTTLPAMLRAVTNKASNPFEYEQCAELMQMYNLHIPKHEQFEEHTHNYDDVEQHQNNMYEYYQPHDSMRVNPLQQAPRDVVDYNQTNYSSNGIAEYLKGTQQGASNSFIMEQQHQQQLQNKGVSSFQQAILDNNMPHREVHSTQNQTHLTNNNHSNINPACVTQSNSLENSVNAEIRQRINDSALDRNTNISGAGIVSQSADFGRAIDREGSATQSLPVINRSVGMSPSSLLNTQQQQQQQKNESQKLPMVYTRSTASPTSSVPLTS